MSSYKMPREQVLKIVGIASGDETSDLFYETLDILSKTVLQYRKENNMTNKELAEKCGITTSVMSRVESGHQNLSLRTICRVLEVIGKKIVIE